MIRYDDARYEVAFDGQVVRTGLARHINLYEKRDGRWQVVWSQASIQLDKKVHAIYLL